MIPALGTSLLIAGLLLLVPEPLSLLRAVIAGVLIVLGIAASGAHFSNGGGPR